MNYANCHSIHWFFINLPISLVILVLAFKLKETKNEKPIKKMDLKGCGALTIVILSIMYAATNLKFHDLANSISSKDVLPFLLIFLISLPIFILIEKKAEDPVLNLHYFTNKQIAITLALSFLEEAAAAQSTFSLIRSIGIAISPNLLINFIADAGSKVPGAIQAVLPKVTGVPGNGALGGKMSTETIAKFQNSDVTTIFNTVKEFVGSMMDGLKNTLASNPHVDFNSIKSGYMASVDTSRATIENTYQSTMNVGFSNLFIGAAVIASIGLLLTLLIKDKKTTEIM